MPLSFAGGALATPAIGRDLGGGPQALAWITNAFMLSFGSLLMAAGALADACGRKRVFLGGVGLFVLMSLALGLAPDTIWLDALRAVQGAAAAAALAGGSAALDQAYPDQGRTRAFSLLGTSFGVGLAAGPVLAGALLDTLGWRAVFLSSALVGAVAGDRRAHAARIARPSGGRPGLARHAWLHRRAGLAHLASCKRPAAT